MNKLNAEARALLIDGLLSENVALEPSVPVFKASAALSKAEQRAMLLGAQDYAGFRLALTAAV